MDDCSNHKKDLFGESDMKKLSEMVGDLHYESLAVFLKELSKKLKQDSRNDWKEKRLQIASRLVHASKYIKDAYVNIQEAWIIAKPFMEPKPPTMTPIQKAKEIVDSFYDFIYQPGMNESWVDKWLESEQAAALLSGEDWISVKDRLPEQSGQVLGCMKDTLAIYVCFYRPDRKLFQVWGAGFDPINDMKVTHWQPLPEPPKP